MKKVVFVLFSLILSFSLSFGANAVEGGTTTAETTTAAQETENTTQPQETTQPVTQPQETTEPTTLPQQTTQPQNPAEPEGTIEDVVSLDGKTIMIVGNSMVYYGNCVILGNQGEADYGYFYQLIASNGENATVIDHTYPGKKLDFIYETYLVNFDPEVLKKVDYLVLSEGNQYNDDLVGTCEKIIALCPNIKGFRFLRQPNMFDVDDEELYLPVLIEQVEKLRAAGYEVVDWGKLVRDIFTREVEVPGATLDFKRTTFMKENLGYRNAAGTAVSAGIRGDRNHQNPLSGYITAQMLYTSLTNRSAVFSDYSFCGDKSIHIYFDLPEFERVHYTGEEKSNFRQVFASAQDMLGLQKLIDIYVAKEGRHPLTVQKGVEATCTANGLTQGSFCSLCGKVVKTQQVIESKGEHELVFSKGKEETCTVDGLSDGISCSRCSEIIKPQQVIPARVHSALTQITPATTAGDGEIKNICRYCTELLSCETVKSVANISISQSNYVYDGLVHTPTVTVLDSENKTLKKDVDYTVSYESGRCLPGKYTVKITLKGNYSGVHRRYFKIAPQAAQGLSAVADSSKVTLQWNAVEGVSGYRVYSYNFVARKYEHIASVTSGTSYTLSELLPGTRCNFKIRSYTKDDGVAWGEYSSAVETATAPAVVSGFTAAQTPSSVSLSWQAVNGATGYRIFKLNEQKGAYELAADVKDNTTCLISGLKSATVHKFTVQAYVEFSGGEVSGEISPVFTTATKPGVTSKITATQTASSITLTWAKVEGATAYRVYRYSASKKAFVSVAYVTDGTSVEFKKLSSGKTYKFKVRAYMDTDFGKFIGANSSEFATATKPAVTSKITATQTASSIKLTWAKVKGATAYRVYRYSASKKAFVSIAYVTDGTSVEFKKLSSGKTYKFKVRAYMDTDFGKFIGANSKEFETATKPATPTLKVSSPSKGKAALTWTNVSGERGYQIYYKTSKTGSYEKYASVKADTVKATVSKLKSGTTCHFRVRAYIKTASGTVYGGYNTVTVKIK